MSDEERKMTQGFGVCRVQLEVGSGIWHEIARTYVSLVWDVDETKPLGAQVSLGAVTGFSFTPIKAGMYRVICTYGPWEAMVVESFETTDSEPVSIGPRKAS